MKVPFFKYQGTGNDFILIDQRKHDYQLNREQIEKLCDRRFGIGADGLILLNQREGYDFEMKTYNADGNESSMCGNGGRTLVQFANDLGIQPSSPEKGYRFIAIDGEHEALIQNSLVHLKMQDVLEVKNTPAGKSLNTGSPHLVCQVQNLDQLDVFTEGRTLRHSPLFAPAGTNVNFVENQNGALKIRTFERGVEDETLSCGTGIIAAALTSADHPVGQHEVSLQARGGLIRVRFEKAKDQSFRQVWLIGPAQMTFQGSVEI
jgi:diaminopimelate epimerase